MLWPVFNDSTSIKAEGDLYDCPCLGVDVCCVQRQPEHSSLSMYLSVTSSLRGACGAADLLSCKLLIRTSNPPCRGPSVRPAGAGSGLGGAPVQTGFSQGGTCLFTVTHLQLTILFICCRSWRGSREKPSGWTSSKRTSIGSFPSTRCSPLAVVTGKAKRKKQNNPQPFTLYRSVNTQLNLDFLRFLWYQHQTFYQIWCVTGSLPVGGCFSPKQ